MSELYLVTGGAGFIGSNIAERLVKNGKKVRVIDNLSTGKVENMDSFINQAEFVHGDIRYLNTVMEAMKGVDYVLHQAALPSVPRSVETPIESNDNNTNGTLNVLYAAKDNNVKRVVYAASSSAYGESPTLPKVETMIPDPLSPYAVNKLIGEYYCSVFSKVYNLETVSLRYFNVFGPRQDPDSQYAAAIPIFIQKAVRNKPIMIFGDGLQTRDFIYVKDIVAANVYLATHPEFDGVYNTAY
ncbi:MAG: NAD-dependent epimerase/dehydratase family protein, partial [Calditrichia bacterium]|nr:NAD-dependent epimerase/dehydratase family protein [Calditrichia bacterium]